MLSLARLQNVYGHRFDNSLQKCLPSQALEEIDRGGCRSPHSNASLPPPVSKMPHLLLAKNTLRIFGSRQPAIYLCPYADILRLSYRDLLHRLYRLVPKRLNQWY